MAKLLIHVLDNSPAIFTEIHKPFMKALKLDSHRNVQTINKRLMKLISPKFGHWFVYHNATSKEEIIYVMKYVLQNKYTGLFCFV